MFIILRHIVLNTNIKFPMWPCNLLRQVLSTRLDSLTTSRYCKWCHIKDDATSTSIDIYSAPLKSLCIQDKLKLYHNPRPVQWRAWDVQSTLEANMYQRKCFLTRCRFCRAADIMPSISSISGNHPFTNSAWWTRHRIRSKIRTAWCCLSKDCMSSNLKARHSRASLWREGLY